MLRDGYDQPLRKHLDVQREDIAAVVWATGYGYDYSWVDPLPLDEWAYPVQQQGVTEVPGLYLLGLHWLHKHKSGLFFGLAEDAEHVVGHLLSTR